MLGSSQTQLSSIRLISATIGNFKELIEKALFRENLFYRINTIEFRVPSLKERTLDIVPLAEYFMAMYCKKYSKSNLTLSCEAICALQDYHWLGNIRELSHLMERAVLLCRDDVLSVSALNIKPSQLATASSADLPMMTLEKAEKQLITQAIDQVSQHVPKAAKLLGLTKSSLYRRLENMPIFNSKSLSAYIFYCLGCFALLFLLSVFWILFIADWQAWNIGLTLVVLGLFLIMGIMGFKNKVMSSFDRALLHIEAVKVEDYNQYAKSEFKEGVTAHFHNELTMLSEKMQTHKSQYDQHALLLYQLIDQLDTPMLVFNKKQKLTYANAAFSTLFGQPWQMYRLASPRLLGLVYTDKGWILPSKEQQWHVSQSAFIDSGERHQLLVFTNIDSAIRASQLNAWQQIIRVMGHEIRNSLTPVSSLAESLASKSVSAREKQALAVISERCHHLQDFVNRYSSLSQTLNLDLQHISVAMFVERLKCLFSQKN